MHEINIKVTCKKTELLEKIKNNRGKHAGVVAESRKGYIEKAKKVLLQKMEALEAGKIVSLHVNLQPPQDFTSVYDTVINMLSMHTGDSLELEAQEFRQFVEDEWDWSRAFWASNAVYSGSANSEATRRGYND